MILLQAPIHDIYLHTSRQFDHKPGYIVLYGLEVTRCATRAEAVRKFAQCLDHAEECETGDRPIFGG